jgi:N6-adenosine-specific RNA methylase IME4
MSIDEICNLPIQNVAATDCHLYVWVTNKYLPLIGKVLARWGFKYSTTLVWCKKPLGGGLGGNYKVTTEYLVFATRGKLKSKRQVTGTWFQVKRPYVNGYPCHYKKPEFFAELIESVSPGPYLEMFARTRRQGWDAFGNEIENSINLKTTKPC